MLGVGAPDGLREFENLGHETKEAPWHLGSGDDEWRDANLRCAFAFDGSSKPSSLSGSEAGP